MKTLLKRYDDATRINHWFVAMLFLFAGLSGMALFHPSLFFLTGLFGGGQWDRTLHPYFGVLMVVGFAVLFLQVWRENVWKPVDGQWLKHLGEMAGGNKSNMPPVGKYNAGQKLVFWAFGVSLLVLLVTGFMFWRPWFAGFFPISLRRVAVTLHAASAFVLVMSVIVHVYAAIWVKGTMQAMMRGTVTTAWARQNHPLWHREKTGG